MSKKGLTEDLTCVKLLETMKEALRLIDRYLENHKQRDLANKLDVSEVTVSRWLSSRKIHQAYVKLIKEKIK